MSVDVTGAAGFTCAGIQGHAGLGGRVQSFFQVVPGTVLHIYVGGKGALTVGGYNGGADDANCGGSPGNSGGGGGASDIRIGGTALSNRIVVAGGGGGTQSNPSCGAQVGGNGGVVAGQGSGDTGGCCCTGGTGGGYGATITIGGNGGASLCCCGTQPAGTLGLGSAGQCGGGGGGGYYGGGGGNCGGSGGGGSSYSQDPAATYFTGFQPNHGYVTLTLYYSPTSQPTDQPSRQPTTQPSGQPTRHPSVQPTVQPTSQPSSQPSQPSGQPSVQPSMRPSVEPSSQPSGQPTVQPAMQPSSQPTGQPTEQPASKPSTQPTGQPSFQPSGQPIAPPSSQPTLQPSARPSIQSTSEPTVQPTGLPSSQPSQQPSNQPSFQPRGFPTSEPSSPPTEQPSDHPSGQPSGLPTTQPSTQPTSVPSNQPTAIPTGQPSEQPSVVPSSQPSSQPSSEPSALPTGQPTVMPTQQKILLQVPTIVDVNAWPSSEHAVLQITFDQISHFGGTVYCAAYKYNLSPSENQLLTEGYQGKFFSVQSIVIVTLPNLVPSTTYHSYCMVLLSSGNKSSLVEIVGTQRTWNTSCCKSISFSHVPRVLNSNSAVYELPDAKQSDYAISYAISASPNTEIIIQPLIVPLDTGSSFVSADFQFFPPFQLFTKISSLLGKFVVSTRNKTVTGDFVLFLKCSGSSGSEFTTGVNRTITFSSIPFPPRLSLAIIGDSGTNMFIAFDSSTNMNTKHIGELFLCRELFNFNSAALTSCVWLNTTTVKASFPANVRDLPKPNDDLQLDTNKIKAACASTFNFCRQFNYSMNQRIRISAPFHPVQPFIVLDVPKIVGSCIENLTIDTTVTTGLGGRAASSFQWNIFRVEEVSPVVSANNSRFYKVASVLNAYSNPVNTFTVQRDNFGTGIFTISLEITNWLGVTEVVTSTLKIVDDDYVPQVALIGTFPMVMYAFQAVKISSRIALPRCLPSHFNLKYQWTLYKDTWDQRVNVSDPSLNPSVLSLLPYSLTAREVYTVGLGVSIFSENRMLSSTTLTELITVKSGVIHAIIRGGNSRQIPFYYNAMIDGSSSYDEDYANAKTNLVFQWSCLVSSFIEFGTNCSSIFRPAADTKSIVVYGIRLEANLTYSITLRVLSSDLQRSSFASVQLQRSHEFSGFTEIESQKALFTTNSNFTLDGLVRANSSLMIGWDAFIDGQNYTFDSFTPLSLAVKKSYVEGGFIYPLVVAANAFPAGAQVTFRLTATVMHQTTENERGSLAPLTQYISTSTIELKVNGAPVNGQVTVDRKDGFGLETDFTIQTSDWEDDPSDYPLKYSFYFTVQPDNPPLTIVDHSAVSSVTTTFPAGLRSFHRQIIIQVVVTDTHSGSSVLTTNITVHYDPNVNVTKYLNSRLKLAFASYDSNLVFSAVNNVATTINQVNCSLIVDDFCAALHRQNCYAVPQSCGSCLPGFRGIVGPSNSLCFSTNSSAGIAGSVCFNNSDCLYGACSNGICTVPTMSCPSTSFDETCSGHGICQYLDLAGRRYPEPCLITNVYCKTSCLCDAEYGGTDCSLSSEVLKERDSNRATMCNAITRAPEFTDASSNLLGSMVNSLFVSYLPEEVISDGSVKSCANALTNISSLAQNGYLAGTDLTVQRTLINAMSNFVIPSPNGRAAYLDSVASEVTSGLFHTIKNGEIPKTINSPNIQISLQKAFVPMLESDVLSPPATDSALAYGAELPSFQIVGSSFEECRTSDGFSHFSLMQWGNNPFPNASSVSSPMLRFSGTIDPTPNSLTDSAYFVSLPFTEEQNFNLNVSVASINAHSIHNVTFPNCTIFEDGHYVSCGNCEILTYTNHNVTFFCKNIQNLCQPAKTTPDVAHRFSVGDDDYFSDDSVQLGSGITASQYGALLEAVGESFVSTLSTNPFNVDIEEAKVVVSLVGSLIVIFLIGGIFFTAWDTNDRLQFVYADSWPSTSLLSITSKMKDKMKKFSSQQKTNRRNGSLNTKQASTSTMLTEDDEVEEGETRFPVQLFADQVIQFFDLVIPTIFHEDPKKGWWKVFKAILIRHDYTSLFSILLSRKIDFCDG
jgi:hypothetical protein